MAQKTDTRTKLLTAPPFQLMLSLSIPAIQWHTMFRQEREAVYEIYRNAHGYVGVVWKIF